jgi:hypothetical protein
MQLQTTSQQQLHNIDNIYPFINDMVDTFYNDNANKLIEKVKAVKYFY